MDVNEVSFGLINGENLDNMAPWSDDNKIIFGDKDKTIYNNLSFNKTSLNKTVKDKSNNQRNLEYIFAN